MRSLAGAVISPSQLVSNYNDSPSAAVPKTRGVCEGGVYGWGWGWGWFGGGVGGGVREGKPCCVQNSDKYGLSWLGYTSTDR